MASKLSAGANHTCQLKADGSVWCWGRNVWGELGNGTNTDSTAPVSVLDPGVHYDSISVTDNFACGLTSQGAVRCWGSNSSGQLGNGVLDSNIPLQVQGLESGVISVSTSGERWGNYGYACALLADKTVKCWGYHPANIGNGTNSSATPVTVAGLTGAVQISTGRGHTCALLESKNAVCWGGNAGGQLGDGTGMDSAIPVQVSGLTNVKKILAASASWLNGGFSCALMENGTVKCWGINSNGTLGNNNNAVTHSLSPVDVFGLTDIEDLAIAYGNDSNGNGTACAIHQSGQVSCWGSNSSGMVGDGTYNPTFIPLQVNNLISRQTAVALGEGGDNGCGHTCALNDLGNFKCWGANGSGQLGDGTTTDRLAP
ncbi:hypothetical protein Bdt_3760 [Bdellovibrio bacteriovorus str. Tiberius]|uniref:RCC1 repeat-containing protein n=1 Tax=Bdellovibrio bacteriovorus str. Tiberius TaxID=1069642 RepID=K7Z0B0_BDEBC|nr:hypothetical protein Bdt_3760 [Bdellovibrio bacteriovorus str. Tiberius]